MSDKKTPYFDMDGVLVDFKSGLRKMGLPEDDGFQGFHPKVRPH